MKYRKLTRTEAKLLHSVGVAVESRHKRITPRNNSCWEGWSVTNRFCLEEQTHFLDEFRVS